MNPRLLLLFLLLVPATAAGQATVTITPWPGGVVPVMFAAATPDQQARFYRACEQWSAKAPVSCVPYTGQPAYLSVTSNGTGCNASLGGPPTGVGSRMMNLDAFCYGGEWDIPHTYMTLAHELGHVFGLIHEHQRTDRDLYLQVYPERAVASRQHDFAPITTNFPQATPYDYQSVMHYQPFQFAAGNLPTMVPYAPVSLGGVQVSALDGQDLARIYAPRASQVTSAGLELELLSGTSNPVRLQWRGGRGLPYYILAGSQPGAWDYGLFPMEATTSMIAMAPVGVVIYVTLATGTGWHDAQFSNTVAVWVTQ